MMNETTELRREFDAMLEPVGKKILSFFKRHINERRLMKEGWDVSQMMDYIVADVITRGREYLLLTPSFLVAIQNEDVEFHRKIKQCFHEIARKGTDGIDERIFQADIPDRIRALLWNARKERLFESREDYMYYPIPIDDGIPVSRFYSDSYCPEPFLDNRGRIYEKKTIQCKRLTPPDETISNALRKDSVSLFEMEMSLSGRRRMKNILFLTVSYAAPNILCHLLRTYTQWVTSIIPPVDLLNTLCLNKGNWTPVLDALEQLSPGISRNIVDDVGNTPLWFCLYRNDHMEFEEALLHYGCNPDQCNHLNLSYNLCKEFRDFNH